MSQKQAVRWCGFRSFPKFPFLVFQLRLVRFAKFLHLRLFRFLTYPFPTNFKQGALGPTSKPEPTKTLEVWMCKRTCSFLTWPAAKPRTALPITTFTTFNFRLMDEPSRLYWNSTSTNYKEWLCRTNFSK